MKILENLETVDIVKGIAGGAAAAAVALPMFRLFQGYYNPEKFYIGEGEPLLDEEELEDEFADGELFDEE